MAASFGVALPLALLLALAWLGADGKGADPAPTPTAPSPPLHSPAPPSTAKLGADVFGINEAVGIPLALVEKGKVPDEDALLAGDARLAREVGARIVRANSATYPWLSMDRMERSGWDWTRADRWFRAVGEAGLESVVVLGPWPGNHTSEHTDRYLPADLAAYEAYVRRVVERYDGDGTDDMPGLARGVLAWEVDNEPDLHNERDSSGFESPEEYAAVLQATSRAVRAAAPDARVLSGGLFRPYSATGRDYLGAVLAMPGAPDAIDGVAIHCYFADDGVDLIDQAMTNVRALAPGKAVWVTETGVPADRRKPWNTEEWQGRMVAAVYGAFLAAGADRIFWHTLADPPPSAGRKRARDFATHSLFRTADGGTRSDKPAAQVYRRLSAHLAAVDASAIHEVPTEGGRLLEAGQGWLAFWGEPPVPPGGRTVEDLATGVVRADVRAARAPAWIGR